MAEIAPLAPDDFEVWLPLWRSYQRFYKVEVPEATTRRTFTRLTQGAEPMGGFIALDDDKAVGFVHWITHRSCWTDGDYCYLQDLFVAEGHRGASVGRRLIASVHAKAIERGCSRVHWLTHESNAIAMELYNKVATRSGFVQYVQFLG